jgi:flagellar biosynthesis GTPase FlhF
MVAAIRRLQAHYMTPEQHLELHALTARKGTARYDVDEAWALYREAKDESTRDAFKMHLSEYNDDQTIFAEKINQLSLCAAKPTPWAAGPDNNPPAFFRDLADKAKTAFMKVICGRDVYVLRSLNKRVLELRKDIVSTRTLLAYRVFSQSVTPMTFEPHRTPHVWDKDVSIPEQVYGPGTGRAPRDVRVAGTTPEAFGDLDLPDDIDTAAVDNWLNSRPVQGPRETREARKRKDVADARELARLEAELDAQRIEEERVARVQREFDEKMAAERRVRDAERAARRAIEEAEEREAREAADRFERESAEFTAREGPDLIRRVTAWTAFLKPDSEVSLSKVALEIAHPDVAGELAAVLAKVEKLNRVRAGDDSVIGRLQNFAADKVAAAKDGYEGLANRMAVMQTIAESLTGVNIGVFKQSRGNSPPVRGSIAWILRETCGKEFYSRAQSQASLEELRDLLTLINLTTDHFNQKLHCLDGSFNLTIDLRTAHASAESKIDDCIQSHELSVKWHDACDHALVGDEDFESPIAELLKNLRENTEPRNKRHCLFRAKAASRVVGTDPDGLSIPIKNEVEHIIRDLKKLWNIDAGVKEAITELTALTARAGQSGGGTIGFIFNEAKKYFRFHMRHACEIDPYVANARALHTEIADMEGLLGEMEDLMDERADKNGDLAVREVLTTAEDMARKRLWHDRLIARVRVMRDDDLRAIAIKRVLDGFQTKSAYDLGLEVLPLEEWLETATEYVRSDASYDTLDTEYLGLQTVSESDRDAQKLRLAVEVERRLEDEESRTPFGMAMKAIRDRYDAAVKAADQRRAESSPETPRVAIADHASRGLG